ncbi:MAG: T9SS type A sorting domain-containing protein [Bacteroidia bacterium]|nr:T9SS type A sorting domain-containing protein [Bacteroidia bacterium]
MNRVTGLSFFILMVSCHWYYGQIATSYDNNGQLYMVVYPDGSQIIYTYDANGNRITRAFSPPGTLAVDDIQLQGRAEELGNRLEWSVVNEVEIQRYEIERMNNNQIFEPIGSTSSRNQPHSTYSFIDKKPLLAEHLYRIKATDVSGSTQYSNRIAIIRAINQILQVYPNPASSTITIEAVGKKTNDAPLSFQLFNHLGQFVLEEQIDLTSQTTQSISVSSFARGLYTYRILSFKGALIRSGKISLQ